MKESSKRIVVDNNDQQVYYFDMHCSGPRPITITQGRRKFYHHAINMMRELKKPNRPSTTPKQRNKNKSAKRLNKGIVNFQHVDKIKVQEDSRLRFHDKFKNSFKPISKKQVRKEKKISSQIKTTVKEEYTTQKAPFSFKFLKSIKK